MPTALRCGFTIWTKARASAAPVLLMHGEPSWSFLYRKVVAALAAKGHRAVAPDLVGFGRSDKPAERSDYTYERHVRWMSDWLTSLDLRNITLFCQDWGGLIGLRLVAAFPDRFARVVMANTGLPVGAGFSPAFEQWLNFSQTVPTLPVGEIVSMGTVRKLSAAEIDAYNAPYPEESYKAGARQFPALVPITPRARLGRREQESVGGAREVREALPDGFFGFRSGHQGR